MAVAKPPVDLASLVLVRSLCKSGEARLLRERLGLSSQDVADAVGIHRATVSRIERGLQVPRGGTAARLATLWGVLMSADTERTLADRASP